MHPKLPQPVRKRNFLDAACQRLIRQVPSQPKLNIAPLTPLRLPSSPQTVTRPLCRANCKMCLLTSAAGKREAGHKPEAGRPSVLSRSVSCCRWQKTTLTAQCSTAFAAADVTLGQPLRLSASREAPRLRRGSQMPCRPANGVASVCTTCFFSCEPWMDQHTGKLSYF